MNPPLLVEMALIKERSGRVDPAVLPHFAELNQVDRPLVLIAERPDGWKPTRSRVDGAFQLQQHIEAAIKRSGGMLDAILYLDFSLFTRNRLRLDALADLAQRYDLSLDQLDAIARPDGRIHDVLDAAGVRVFPARSRAETVQGINKIARNQG